MDQFSIAWDAISWIESAGLQIVPANLLDAVIAAVERSHQECIEGPLCDCFYDHLDGIIAAIRAAWEGATDGD